MKRYLIELLINLDSLANLLLMLSAAAFGLSGIWLLFYSDGAPVEKIACAKGALRYALITAGCCAPALIFIPDRKQLRKLTERER